MSGRDVLEKPFRGELSPQPEGPSALQHHTTDGSELNPRAGIVVVEGDLVVAGPALDLAGTQLLDLVDRFPGDDALLRRIPDVGRLVLAGYILRMHDVQIGAPDDL